VKIYIKRVNFTRTKKTVREPKNTVAPGGKGGIVFYFGLGGKDTRGKQNGQAKEK